MLNRCLLLNRFVFISPLIRHLALSPNFILPTATLWNLVLREPEEWKTLFLSKELKTPNSDYVYEQLNMSRPVSEKI